MVSISSSLRNIRPGGGLFTENIILRLRDTPEQLEIGNIKSFIETDSEKERKEFQEKRRDIFEWGVQKWDEISPTIETWTLEDLVQKWFLPFFKQFDHEIEDFEIIEENPDDDSPLKDFSISHQTQGHENPFFHFVSIQEDFDSKIEGNPLRKSHHEVCQQFINLHPEIKWLFLSNGRLLRILTKYYHSYSKGFLEFDLENIFANRDFFEFKVLHSIIHSSRYISETADETWLIQKFQENSSKEGVKIGDALRDNVQEAIELLGNGLIQQNLNFIEKINNDEIEAQEFYAELLRIIYRIIFILYAEQRAMLPGAGTLYFEQFSLSSFRMLAEKPIKADKNYDLWNKLFITFGLVREGNDILDVPCYNGELFRNEKLPIILGNNLRISNDLLLRIIRLLTSSTINNIRQRVNFSEIREEEIGSIYESLLDFQPNISINSQFQLIPQTTERKSTGSYYTPKELIDILIRTTLQPLIEDRLKNINNPQEREKSILDIKICDPACGGGTFLLAGLDFLGKKLAEVRTGVKNPSEDDLRIARRDILQHGIYGVDKNPLAVELAKISLWLRACVKDKPLNFLDNHIKLGNSLIGLGQKEEITSIIPDAFVALPGNNSTGIPAENKKIQNSARKAVRNEIKVQKTKGKTTRITAFFTEERTADICSEEFQKIIELREDSAKSITEKEKEYKNLRKNPNYQQALNEANIWTSTFFWPFEGDTLRRIPSYVLIDELRNGLDSEQNMKLLEKINDLAEENRFFHWYVEFPEVFSSERGGFDCILTNPPWDVLEFKEEEFFTGVSKVTSKQTQAARRSAIRELREGSEKEKEIHRKYLVEWRNLGKLNNFLRVSGRYPLSSKGTINTYAVFVERCSHLLSKKGRTGIIVPTQIATAYFMQDLFRDFIENHKLLSLFDFENKKKIFPIHSSFRFSLLTLGSSNSSQGEIPMAFYCQTPEDVQEVLEIIPKNEKNLKKYLKFLPPSHRLFAFTIDDFKELNPNTLTCPVFKTRHDAELIRHLYKQTPIFLKKNANTNQELVNAWNFSFKQGLFNVSSDSEDFENNDQDSLRELGGFPEDEEKLGGRWFVNEEELLPFYEGRMIWLYDHRFNSSIMIQEEDRKRKAKSITTTLEQHKNPNYFAIPRFWISKKLIEEKIPNSYNYGWFVGFRDVTGTTNERSMVLTVIPRCGVGHTLPLILSNIDARKICGLIANFSSLILDFTARQKISGTHMTFYNVEQFPIFPPDFYNEELLDLIVPKVIELIYTAGDIKAFASDCGFDREPFEWNPERRAILQAELDAIYAHLYKITKDDIEYIIGMFTRLRAKEETEFREFKTKKLVLDEFDRLSSTIKEILKKK